jgi:hypothetical protein
VTDGVEATKFGPHVRVVPDLEEPPDDGWDETVPETDEVRSLADRSARPDPTTLPTQPTALESRWVRLADCPEVLCDEPPRQSWLLTRWHNRQDIGVLPKGKTGLLASTGGVGKTMALLAAAVAVATGGLWLGHFQAQQGHVLLCLGEEDLDEARRRLYRVCNALELSREQRKAVAERIDLLPLAGVPVQLTSSPSPGVVEVTAFADELRTHLEARGVDWTLIVLDPLSRWAGGGVEANNEIATRFVQLIESFTTIRGNPTVLVAHHSSKTSAKEGASDARGVTGIRDGFRWMISLDAVTSDDGGRAVRLSNGKSNYSSQFDPIILVRSEEPGCEGTLRAASKAEAEPFTRGEPERRLKERQARERTKHEGEVGAVLDAIPAEPEHTTQSSVDSRLREKGIRIGDQRLRSLLAHLATIGAIRDASDGQQSSGRKWCRGG